MEERLLALKNVLLKNESYSNLYNQKFEEFKIIFNKQKNSPTIKIKTLNQVRFFEIKHPNDEKNLNFCLKLFKYGLIPNFEEKFTTKEFGVVFEYLNEEEKTIAEELVSELLKEFH